MIYMIHIYIYIIYMIHIYIYIYITHIYIYICYTYIYIYICYTYIYIYIYIYVTCNIYIYIYIYERAAKPNRLRVGITNEVIVFRRSPYRFTGYQDIAHQRFGHVRERNSTHVICSRSFLQFQWRVFNHGIFGRLAFSLTSFPYISQPLLVASAQFLKSQGLNSWKLSSEFAQQSSILAHNFVCLAWF